MTLSVFLQGIAVVAFCEVLWMAVDAWRIWRTRTPRQTAPQWQSDAEVNAECAKRIQTMFILISLDWNELERSYKSQIVDGSATPIVDEAFWIPMKDEDDDDKQQ